MNVYWCSISPGDGDGDGVYVGAGVSAGWYDGVEVGVGAGVYVGWYEGVGVGEGDASVGWYVGDGGYVGWIDGVEVGVGVCVGVGVGFAVEYDRDDLVPEDDVGPLPVEAGVFEAPMDAKIASYSVRETTRVTCCSPL